jgi:UDP:flavonoid glycosyltransferase YjiC (YdhE family)
VTVVFYISGHGFGHAVRMGEVMRALHRKRPDWRLLARTQAPRSMLPEFVEYEFIEIDSGVVEREAGVIVDEAATTHRLRSFIERWDEIVAAETAFLRDQRVQLIVADIPPIAGDIAHASGIPCVAITNFTWDWIHEPYARAYLGPLEMAYSRMETLLRLPFAQSSRLEGFRSIIDVPLIARKSATVRVPHAKRRALLGSRAQVSADALAFASASAPEFDFIAPSPQDNFTDVLASCDVVIAKLGFSMVAEKSRSWRAMWPGTSLRCAFRSRTFMEAIGRRTSRSCPRYQ